jgi:hypothetical protein
VVESDSVGDMGAAAHTVSQLPAVYRDNHIALYRIGGDSAGVPADRRNAVLVAHFAWLALLVVGGAGLLAARWRPVRPGR